jgi:Xaa-Pro aminopeptidase
MFQLLWLNNYHAKVREIIGEEMLRQGLNDVYEWLVRKTEPILGNSASSQQMDVASLSLVGLNMLLLIK